MFFVRVPKPGSSPQNFTEIQEDTTVHYLHASGYVLHLWLWICSQEDIPGLVRLRQPCELIAARKAPHVTSSSPDHPHLLNCILRCGIPSDAVEDRVAPEHRKAEGKTSWGSRKRETSNLARLGVYKWGYPHDSENLHVFNLKQNWLCHGSSTIDPGLLLVIKDGHHNLHFSVHSVQNSSIILLNPGWFSSGVSRSWILVIPNDYLKG